MKVFRVLFGVLAAAAITAGSAMAQNAGKIQVVGGDTYDWGTVSPGVLKATIEVKNVGTAPLNISGVQPSCGCTTAPIDKNVLAPNETAKIAVSVDVANKQGMIEKTITVNSDDIANKSQIIRLKANVKRDYTVSPASYVMINDGKVGIETTQSVRVMNTGDAPLIISAPTFESGNVKVRFESKDKVSVPVGAETTLTFYVTPLGNKPVEGQPVDYAINGTIGYKVSSTTLPDLKVNIYGSTAPPQSAVTPAATSPTVMSPVPATTVPAVPAQTTPSHSH